MTSLTRALAPLALAASWLVPASASAQEASPPQATGGAFMADAKIGGVLAFGGLDPNVRPAIGLGYMFGWKNRSIAAQLQVDYASFKAKGSDQDPRVTGGSYAWDLTEQTLVLFPWGMYRFTSLGRLVPFVGIGPRVYMLRSNIKGSAAGGPLPETKEQSTKVGAGIPFGAEFKLGPGGLLGELLLEYGPLDHKVTGSSNTGALSLFLGYRFQI